MKNCAIICEYNPFHNGHKYQIDYLKNNLGFNFVIIVMSGHFSQRATPSLLDKYTRTMMIDGADLVCQIPTAYAINNGEVFATAGVKIINSLGIKYICFGVETLNEKLFDDLAQKMLNESENYKKNLKEELSKGLNFKTANLISIEKSYGKEYSDLLSTPNNILALEYIKAIKKYGYDIKPILIKRCNDYMSTDTKSNIVSATQIRETLFKNNDIYGFMPEKSYNILKNNFNKNYTLNFKNLVYISMLNIDKERLKNTYNVNEGIENRIISATQKSKNYDELINNIVTKRYDKNKINRIILCYLLGITKDVIKNLYNNEPDYIKVLYLNKKILSEIDTSKIILRKNDINPYIENNILEQIENKANIFANYIYDKDLLVNDIFIKPVIK